MSIITDSRLAADIESGFLDEELDSILAACERRRSVVDTEKVNGLKPGDKARFTKRISPKYLGGLEVTVKALKGSKVDVELDESAKQRLEWMGRRFGRYSTITTPKSLLEPIRRAA